ncbi:MAG: acyl carrier protein [Dehalococcoidales bacterium]|nr:acyl carrier protein [Dehalococcoidales bacterium]MDD4230281.1 acyl carrier protein [Dehalococcoidales bacterium]MDD4465386.1 acyl carrier protein [Dehalococcoidales bacterium]
MDIHAELKKAICKVNPGINEENITPEATFIGDLEMDSLSMVELSLAMEDSFGITLPDEELAKLTTVGEVTELIESKLGK